MINITIKSMKLEQLWYCVSISVLMPFASTYASGDINNASNNPIIRPSILIELADKQKALTTFTGVIVTKKPNYPEIQDRIFYRSDTGQYRLDELQESFTNAIKAGRSTAIFRYYDGSNFWEEVGDVIVKSTPSECPFADQVFVNLRGQQGSKFSVQTNNAEAGICILEHEIQDPQMARMLEGISNPKVLEYLAAKGVNVPSEQMSQVLQRIQDSPRARERLWIDLTNGICFKREISRADGKLLQSSTLSNLQVGVTIGPEMFRPNLAGKQIIEASYPYDKQTQWKIAEERTHIRLPVTQIIVVTNRASANEEMTQAIIDEFDALWKKKDLTRLKWKIVSQALGTPDFVPALLAKAAYSALVENDQKTSEELLKTIDAIVKKSPGKGYDAYKKSLHDAENLFSVQGTNEERIEALFETYKEGFPLRNDIMKAGREFKPASEK